MPKLLQKYSKKRNFKKTPEPGVKIKRKATGDLIFVVQKHAASRLHYDFRLECDGVLLSWAVPKGPSTDPSQKHLAVMVEDHPFDYKDFEGTIPEGQYGAGQVIVWDNGTYSPSGQYTNKKEAESAVRKGIKAGKLSFTLYGKKLKGEWALVKLRGTEKQWLLIKHDDEYADKADITRRDNSAISKKRLVDPVSNSKSKPTSKKSDSFPKSIAPMLANLVDKPFTKNGWAYEPKLDGIRAIAYVHNGKVDLRSRRGIELNTQFPNIVSALSYNDDAVFDGEIVALDEKGRPSFQLLQNRGVLKPSEKMTIAYYVFDVLYFEGQDLAQMPLEKRKDILHSALKTGKFIHLVEGLPGTGEECFEACVKNGLEGIVAKQSSSRYEPGRRSSAWLKIKAVQSAEFVIGGYTTGTGSRSKTFGALLVGFYEGDKLRFAGGVGTGYDDKTLATLLKAMKPLQTIQNPFSSRIHTSGKPVWIKPRLVAEVKYAELTRDKILRSPVFLRLREDISPKQTGPRPVVEISKENKNESKTARVELDKSTGNRELDEIKSQLLNAGEDTELSVQGETIRFSHLDKEFWPCTKGPSITKREYASYLIDVSPFLLPHMKNRPLTLIRFPNGITGQKFFQKHWERNLPDFVETVSFYSEDVRKDQDYLMCNNLPTLLWLAQIAVLELHTVHCRIDPEPDGHKLGKKFTGSVKNIESSLLNYPDFVVFDLDPYLYSGKEAKGEEPELHKKGFRKTCEMALLLKEILDDLKLSAFIKTSGKTGLHIYVPIIRDIDYDSVRAVAESFGRYLLEQHPKDLTMQWAVASRKGKVFFDYSMNVRGKTLASLYSPRSAPNATISTPLSWNEVGKIYPNDFTLRNIGERLEAKGDLWKDILKHKNDLHKKLDLTGNEPSAVIRRRSTQKSA